LVFLYTLQFEKRKSAKIKQDFVYTALEFSHFCYRPKAHELTAK